MQKKFFEQAMTGPEYDTTPYDEYAQELSSNWKKNARANKTTAFIGDSFFDKRYFWTDFYNVYAGKDALCMGIGSTTTFDWEKFIANGFFEEISPKNIILHLGTNNIYDDLKGAETSEDIERLLSMLHEKLPSANIYYFAISLRAYDEEKIALTKLVNERVCSWCKDNGIHFLNDTVRLTPDRLRDGVHPKADAYEVFINAIKTSVKIENL